MPSTRRTGLGRGLSALIPGGPGASHLDEIPVAQIRPNHHQPRAAFDEESLSTLTESIREVGVLQPVLLRPAGAGYELIAGERRWRAAQRAGLTTIPAMVKEADDSSVLEQALIENLHRDDLNPLEEAAAYQQLIDDFGLTHDEGGRRVGRSRPAVTNALRLLGLPGRIQARSASGELSSGHARAILALRDPQEQEELAQQAVRQGWSVRTTEEAVTRRLAAAEAEVGEERARPSATVKAPALLEVETSLSDYLETRVRVEAGGRRGRVVIDFGSMEELGRIWRLVGVPTGRSA